MKKLFSKTVRNSKKLVQIQMGFTLVELLVVIAIMAILATIGVSVFSAAQGSARDGKRLSELNSIAKSIESSKAYESSTSKYKYTYTTTDLGKDFPQTTPGEPGKEPYCITWTTGTTTITPLPADPSVWTEGTACSAIPTVAPSSETWKKIGGSSADIPAAYSWKVCSYQERKSTSNCVTSLQK